jgi:act minimal PKS acyl carrier protein
MRILTASVGELDTVPAEQLLDCELADLGCDSLALIETATRIKQEYGVVIPDDEVTEVRTPRELLAAVSAAARAS